MEETVLVVNVPFMEVVMKEYREMVHAIVTQLGQGTNVTRQFKFLIQNLLDTSLS